jgi:hypothetical protein
MFVSLFTHHIGKTRNQPIVRFGKVALLPDEKVQSGPKTVEDLYLMECNSFEGNSGSPVFFEISLTRRPLFMPQRLFLAGVMKGHFKYPLESGLPIDEYDKSNIGIAAVTPSHKLREILYSEGVKNFRIGVEKASFENWSEVNP